MKKQIVFLVKTTTETGADFKVKSFKSREDAINWKDANRNEYPRELFIEKFIF